MSELLLITTDTVKIGEDDGTVIELPLSCLNYPDPKVGDMVKVYKDGDSAIVKREQTVTGAIITDTGDRRRVNKVAYILVTFFLGGLGIHRFMRGQVGIGVVMLLFSWLTFGIWWLVDFIISLTKLSVYPGDDYLFTPDGRFAK